MSWLPNPLTSFWDCQHGMPSFRWPCSDRCGTEILQALEILEAPWAGQRGLRIAVDFFQLLHWMLDDACIAVDGTLEDETETERLQLVCHMGSKIETSAYISPDAFLWPFIFWYIFCVWNKAPAFSNLFHVMPSTGRLEPRRHVESCGDGVWGIWPHKKSWQTSCRKTIHKL